MPALAVTINMATTLVMCLAVIFVCTMSNLAVSLVRNRVPTNIRIIVQMTIISSFGDRSGSGASGGGL